MAQCKLNKISKICDMWRCNNKSEEAMQQIQSVINLKEEEMPDCTCGQKEESGHTCSLVSKHESSTKDTCPMAKESNSCEAEEEKEHNCHNPGPTTINPFFNFMKELRETTCFNKTVTEVAKEAACKWSKMTDCEKGRYIIEAYKVSRKKPTKRENSDSVSSMCGKSSKVRKTA